MNCLFSFSKSQLYVANCGVCEFTVELADGCCWSCGLFWSKPPRWSESEWNWALHFVFPLQFMMNIKKMGREEVTHTLNSHSNYMRRVMRSTLQISKQKAPHRQCLTAPHFLSKRLFCAGLFLTLIVKYNTFPSSLLLISLSLWGTGVSGFQMLTYMQNVHLSHAHKNSLKLTESGLFV